MHAPRGLSGAAGLRAGPSIFPPARAHARIVARCCALRILVLLADVLRRALPRRPRRHDARLHGCRDRGRRSTRSAARSTSGNGAMPPGSMAAGALLGDDRCDVLREARRCRSARSALSSPRAMRERCERRPRARRGPRLRARSGCRYACWASYVPQSSRRTPQISPTVHRARSASRMGGRRFASVSAASRTSASDRAAASPSRSARTRAVRSRWRRSIAGIDVQELDLLRAGVLGECVHADDDALARLDLGLVAERRRLDLRLDEPLLDRCDRAAEFVDARDELARALARARR